MTIQQVTGTVKPSADGGGWEGILSTASVDRQGEVVDPAAFDPLPADIPFHVDHDMTTAGVVGTGVPYYDGAVLRVRGRFANEPKAQRIRRLVQDGHIKTMSVGFRTLQRTKDKAGTPHVVKAELLEASFVTVPANLQATVTSVRSAHGGMSAREALEQRAVEILADEILTTAKAAIASADRQLDAQRAERDAKTAATMRRLGLPDGNDMDAVLAWARAEKVKEQVHNVVTARAASGTPRPTEKQWVHAAGVGMIQVSISAGEPELEPNSELVPPDERTPMTHDGTPLYEEGPVDVWDPDTQLPPDQRVAPSRNLNPYE